MTDESPGLIRVEFECQILSPNRLMGEHYKSRHWRRRRERRAVVKALNGKPLPPGPWTVTLTRCSALRIDSDNAAMALKSFRDETAAFIGVNDRSPDVEWLYRQETRREKIPPEARTKWTGAFRCWCRIEICTRPPGRRCAACGQCMPAEQIGS